MELRPKPLWLHLLTGDYWVALFPTVYHPRHVDPSNCPAIQAHEAVHLRQQRGKCLLLWVAKYLISRAFRYRVELEAHAIELNHGATIRSLVRRLAKYHTGLSKVTIENDIKRLAKQQLYMRTLTHSGLKSDPGGCGPPERGSGLGSGGPSSK